MGNFGENAHITFFSIIRTEKENRPGQKFTGYTPIILDLPINLSHKRNWWDSMNTFENRVGFEDCNPSEPKCVLKKIKK